MKMNMSKDVHLILWVSVWHLKRGSAREKKRKKHSNESDLTCKKYYEVLEQLHNEREKMIATEARRLARDFLSRGGLH